MGSLRLITSPSGPRTAGSAPRVGGITLARGFSPYRILAAAILLTVGLGGCMAEKAERERDAAAELVQAESERFAALEAREAARVEAEIARIRGESQEVIWEAVGKLESAEAGLKSAEERLAAALESDAAMFDIAELGVGIAAGFFPLAGVGVPILRAVRNRSRKGGIAEGAQIIVESVAALRTDPAVDRALKDVSPQAKAVAHEIMGRLPEATKALEKIRKTRAAS